MRIARAIAAAALTLGLTATLAPAQASPSAQTSPQVASSAATTQLAATPTQANAVPAPTKLTGKGPSGKVKVGKTIKVTGKLTRKGKKGYKPLAKKKVLLILPGWDGTPILAEAKTSKSGRYTLKFKAIKYWAGVDLRTCVWFDGDAKSDFSHTGYIIIKVKK